MFPRVLDIRILASVVKKHSKFFPNNQCDKNKCLGTVQLFCFKIVITIINSLNL